MASPELYIVGTLFGAACMLVSGAALAADAKKPGYSHFPMLGLVMAGIGLLALFAPMVYLE